MHNPLYRKNKIFVDLSPEKVEWIVFWSRDYHHFLKHRSYFHSYKLFFHFTIISAHSILEKQHISLSKAVKQAELLAQYYGGDHIIWRYDPIVFWREDNHLVSNFNESEFAEYCRLLSACGITRCFFSFVTHYFKFIKRFQTKYPHYTLVPPDYVEIKKILDVMKNHTSNFDINLFSCCNDNLVDDIIKRGSCISGKFLNHLSGKKTVSEARSPTREECACTRSIDIGDYVQQPCYFGCIYCYANPVWR